MSQIYKPGTGGGGSGIDTILGDVGSVTGSTVTIFADNAANNSGSSVEFVATSATVMQLNVTDTNSNTIIGLNAGNLSISGIESTVLGNSAFSSATSSSDCVAIGNLSLHDLKTGDDCIAIGSLSLNNSVADDHNVAIGSHSLQNLNGGSRNTAVGYNSANVLLTGSFNATFGHNVGTNYTGAESSNILFNSTGTTGDSNTLRIGDATGSGNRQLDTAFIHGINGNTVSNTQIVTIDSVTSQLGTISISGASWIDEGVSFTAVSGTDYFCTSTLTVTLPVSPSQGDTIILYVDTGIITIQSSGTQSISIGSSSSAIGGTATNIEVGDSITLVYRSATNKWKAISSIGSWTLS